MISVKEFFETRLAPHQIPPSIRHRHGVVAAIDHVRALASGMIPFEHAPINVVSGMPDIILDPGPIQDYDQGGIGSCGGHGVARALAGRLRELLFLKPTDPDPSPDVLYKLMRSLMGYAGNLSDTGIDATVILPALQKWGWRGMTAASVQDPGDDAPRYSDCSQANLNIDLALDDVEQTLPNIQPKCYLITATDLETRMKQIGAALHSRWRIVNTGPCGDSWQAAWQNGTPAPAQNLDDPNTGGHCTDLEGLQTFNGVQCVVIGNSWGDTSGLLRPDGSRSARMLALPELVAQFDCLIAVEIEQ